MEIASEEKGTRRTGAVRPDPTKLPVRQPKKKAADFLREFYFDISPRTLERAPIPAAIINGKTHYLTTDLIAYGESVVAEAPVVMGGHRQSNNNHAE